MRYEALDEPWGHLRFAPAEIGLRGGELEGDAFPVFTSRLADLSVVIDLDGLRLRVGTDVVERVPTGAADDVGEVEFDGAGLLGFNTHAGDVTELKALRVQLIQLALHAVDIEGQAVAADAIRENLLVELGERIDVVLQVSRPFGRVHFGVSGFLAHGSEAAKDFLEGGLALGDAVVGEGQVVELGTECFELLGQFEHALVGDFLRLDTFPADIDEREGALAIDADGREVGRTREVLKGQRMVASLDGGGEVADDLGAVPVDRDRMDLGGGGGDVCGGCAER